MFLAGKAACAGIIFLLLATWISGPRPTKVVPVPNLSKEEPAVGPRTDILKMQETLRDKGHYRGKIDGVFGLRTRASIRAFQKAQGQPATGQLDIQTASKLGVTPEGRGKTGNETTQDKPSAGIRSVRGSRRTSKIPPKAINTVADPESSRGKTLQADNETHDR
jgi:peptidoglycan hydrolase-like protein with peptidoglycan-binding domain